MKMNQKGKGNDEFCTPKHIFQQLNNIFNFELDVAADDNNHLCDRWITKEMNALKYPWFRRRVYCNPPFSQKAEFIRKADKEVQEGHCLFA